MIPTVCKTLNESRLLCRSNELVRSTVKPCWHHVTRGSIFSTPREDLDYQQGIVDVVNVEDWGPENVGDLKTSGRVRRVLDNSRELPFMQRIANFLADAERMGNIGSLNSMPIRDIPPFERWAFKESHYEQYLVDLLCVNKSLSGAIKRALDALREYDTNMEIFDPISLGLYRGEWIEKDINQLKETRAEGYDPRLCITSPSEFAWQYSTLLDDLSESLSSDPDSIEILISRLCAHIYMISVSQLALGNRIGSVCVERIGLIKRRAASTYTEYVTEKPPLSVLADSVNSWGDNRSEPHLSAFFEELPVAASKCSMLVDSLARE